MTELKEAFSLFDRSGQNTIEASHLGDILRAIGYNPTQAQVKELVAKITEGSSSGRCVSLRWPQELKPSPIILKSAALLVLTRSLS